MVSRDWYAISDADIHAWSSWDNESRVTTHPLQLRVIHWYLSPFLQQEGFTYALRYYANYVVYRQLQDQDYRKQVNPVK